MPIHARFAARVKNAALSAYIQAEAKLKGIEARFSSSSELNEFFLKSERLNRESYAANVQAYRTALANFRSEDPPALTQSDFLDLTSPHWLKYVSMFFQTNPDQIGQEAKVVFIRHKVGKKLKRIEFMTWSSETDKDLVAVVWKDK